MNNHKRSTKYLWLGIIAGLAGALFFYFYRTIIEKSKKDQPIIKKYVNISDTEMPSQQNKIMKRTEISNQMKKDDLKVINGIGPAIEKLLNENKIFSYFDLSTTKVEDLRAILAGKNLYMADPQNWPTEASQLISSQ